jgi:hypothetical protein
MLRRRELALGELAGVGDATLGEWVHEGNGGVSHVRRRLSVAEAAGLDLIDVRGTPEAERRLRRVAHQLPAHVRPFVLAELDG